MKLSGNLLLSLEILSAHKLRTALSVLGVVVGVAAVVLMVAVGRGAERRILGLIDNMGTNLVVVNAGQTRIIAGRQRQIEQVTTLVPSDAEAIAAECPAVVAAAPATAGKLTTRWETELYATNVVGMSPDGFALRNFRLATGRGFTEAEDRGRRRVAVIGPTAAINLFPGRDPLGYSFRIGQVPFEVIGITAPKGTDFTGADLDDIVIVPLQTAMRRLFNEDHIETVYVQGHGLKDLGRVEREVAELLRQRHRLRDRPDDFTIQNQATLLSAERQTARALTLLIGSVAGISLLVGGVGILAVMLIAVRERAREIGLRRALGARQRDIRTQFLLESGLLSLSGGLLGMALGILAALGLGWFGRWETSVSWPAVATGFFFSVTVGVVFGYYPALRAARLEPIQALRSE